MARITGAYGLLGPVRLIIDLAVMNMTAQTQKPALIMWVLWFAILQGIFLLQWFLGGGIPEGENVAEPMSTQLWVISAGLIVASTAVRWLVIPKLGSVQSMLTAMIVGLAMAEAALIVSLLLMLPDYPQYQVVVLLVAFVAILQHAPFYAQRSA